MGLVNNSTGPATEVEILTIPTDPVTFDPNTIPTTWHQVQVNSFTETNGIVTMAEFEANDPSNSLLDSIRYTFVMDTLGIVYSQPSDHLSYPGQGNGYIEQFIVQDDTNINEDQIKPVTVPEPSTAFLLSAVLLAAALVARKRIGHNTDHAFLRNPIAQERKSPLDSGGDRLGLSGARPNGLPRTSTASL